MSFNPIIPNVDNQVRDDLIKIKDNFQALLNFLDYDHNLIESVNNDGFHRKVTLPLFNPSGVTLTDKVLIYNKNTDLWLKTKDSDILLSTTFNSNNFQLTGNDVNLNNNITIPNYLSIIGTTNPDTFTTAIDGSITYNKSDNNLWLKSNGKWSVLDSGGSSSSGIETINNISPDQNKNLNISSSDNTLILQSDQSKNAINIAVNRQEFVSTVGNSKPDPSTHNIYLTSSNGSIIFDDAISYTQDFKVDPSAFANGDFGVESIGGNLQVKVDSKADNKLSISSAGLYVSQTTTTDIKSINSITADPSNNYNLNLIANDATNALTITNNPNTFTITTALDYNNMISTSSGNSLSVASDGKLFAQGGANSSTLQGLIDDQGTFFDASTVSNKGIQLSSSDGSVSITGSNPTSTSVIFDLKAKTPDQSDYSYANTIYISNNGDDTTGDGTYEKPYKTVNKAVLESTTTKNDIKIKNNDNDNYIFDVTQSAINIPVSDDLTIDLSNQTVNKRINIIPTISKDIKLNIKLRKLDQFGTINFDLSAPSSDPTKIFTIQFDIKEIVLTNTLSLISISQPSTSSQPDFIAVNLNCSVWNESLYNTTTTAKSLIDLMNYTGEFLVKLTIDNSKDNSNKPSVLYTVFENKPSASSSELYIDSKSVDIVSRSVFDLSTISLITPEELRLKNVQPLISLQVPDYNSNIKTSKSISYDVSNRNLKFVDNFDNDSVLIQSNQLSSIVSDDVPNGLNLGSDNKLFVDTGNLDKITINNQQLVSGNFNIVSSNNSLTITNSVGQSDLSFNVQGNISTDSNNSIRQGTDGKLYASTGGSTGGKINSINSVFPNTSTGDFLLTGNTQIKFNENSSQNGLNASLDIQNINSPDQDNLIVVTPQNQLKLSNTLIGVKTINNQPSDTKGNFNITATAGGFSVSQTVGSLDLKPKTSSTIDIDSSQNLEVKLSATSDNLITRETDGLYVKASAGQKFVKTINSLASDNQDNIEISSSDKTIDIDNASTPNTIELKVDVPELISKSPNNTIKVGDDGLLFSDAGSSQAGINSINNIQPDSSKNFSILSTTPNKQVVVITSATNGITLGYNASNSLSTDTGNEITIGSDNGIFFNGDKDFIRSVQGILPSENPNITFKSSPNTISFTKDTTQVGDIDVSLIINTNTQAVISQNNGLQFNISKQPNNGLSIKSDGLFSTAGGGSTDNYRDTIWIDIINGSDDNNGTTISKAVKSIDTAITKAIALQDSKLWIKTVPLNSTQNLSRDISISDSRINLDLDINLTGNISYTTQLHNVNNIKIRSLTGGITLNTVQDAAIFIDIETIYTSNSTIINNDSKNSCFISLNNRLLVYNNQGILTNAPNSIINWESEIITKDYIMNNIFIADSKSSLTIKAGGKDNG